MKQFKHAIKITIILSLTILSTQLVSAQNNVGIGTITPNSKSILELKATDKGFMAPRLTTTQMLAIAPTATESALLIYNIDSACYHFYNGVAWKNLCAKTTATTALDTAILNAAIKNYLNSHATTIINILKADTSTLNVATINLLTVDTSITNVAIINNATINTLSVDSSTINYANINNAVIDSSKTNFASINNAVIDSSTINYANINNAVIDSLQANYINATTGNFNTLNVGGQNIMQTMTDSITAQAWLIKGNNASATNKLGTTNAQDLHMYAGGIERITIANTTGNVGINTTTPAVALHIATTDGIAVPTGTTGQQPIGAPIGTTRYNTTLSTMEVYNGTCWPNINTPPIGASYVQWAQVADPNTLYACTVWISTDVQNGEFLRATGGNANVAAGGVLTATVQTDAVQDHTHNGSGTANGSGALTTTNAGTHSHNWGGNWSIDDSRLFTADNGDGNGNTLSDGRFWWGGSGATGSTGTDYNIVGGTTVNGAHNHSYTYGFPETPSDGSYGVGGFGTHREYYTGTTSTDGGHSHNVEHFAHRHWIKTRPTTTAPDHSHTVPDHAHTLNINVGTMNTGNVSTETRPVNVAVKYWRRVS